MEMKIFKKMSLPPKEDCHYTSCYCEENVWKLCEYVSKHFPLEVERCATVFISNKSQLVPLWNQQSSQSEDKLAIWDYHVIFIYYPEDESGTLVYDLDTTLGFPVPFKTYIKESIRSDVILKPEYYRMFRVIKAKCFLENFASDRSKMRNPDGTWIKPPPPYPCIQVPGQTNNLNDFISMNSHIGFGDVMDLQQLLQRFQ